MMDTSEMNFSPQKPTDRFSSPPHIMTPSCNVGVAIDDPQSRQDPAQLRRILTIRESVDMGILKYW